MHQEALYFDWLILACSGNHNTELSGVCQRADQMIGFECKVLSCINEASWRECEYFLYVDSSVFGFRMFSCSNFILLPRCYLNDLTCKVHVHYKQPALRSLVTLKLFIWTLSIKAKKFVFWSNCSPFLLYWRLSHDNQQIINL